MASLEVEKTVEELEASVVVAVDDSCVQEWEEASWKNSGIKE